MNPVRNDNYVSREMISNGGNVVRLQGEIIYIDRFGNLIPSIDKDTFGNFIKNKKSKVYIKNEIIDRLSHSYSQGESSEPLALMSSFNYLEIAIPCGSAQSSLNASNGTKIEVIRI